MVATGFLPVVVHSQDHGLLGIPALEAHQNLLADFRDKIASLAAAGMLLDNPCPRRLFALLPLPGELHPDSAHPLGVVVVRHCRGLLPGHGKCLLVRGVGDIPVGDAHESVVIAVEPVMVVPDLHDLVGLDRHLAVAEHPVVGHIGRDLCPVPQCQVRVVAPAFHENRVLAPLLLPPDKRPQLAVAAFKGLVHVGLRDLAINVLRGLDGVVLERVDGVGNAFPVRAYRVLLGIFLAVTRVGEFLGDDLHPQLELIEVLLFHELHQLAVGRAEDQLLPVVVEPLAKTRRHPAQEPEVGLPVLHRVLQPLPVDGHRVHPYRVLRVSCQGRLHDFLQRLVLVALAVLTVLQQDSRGVPADDDVALVAVELAVPDARYDPGVHQGRVPKLPQLDGDRLAQVFPGLAQRVGTVALQGFRGAGDLEGVVRAHFLGKGDVKVAFGQYLVATDRQHRVDDVGVAGHCSLGQPGKA